MTPLHTIKLTHTPTSITIELDDPTMSIEVRVRASGKRSHVEVYRPLPSGALTMAGALGSYGDPARAMEIALEAAQILAIGLGIAALRGEVSPTTTLVPPSTYPRTHVLVEQAVEAVGRLSKIFGKALAADLHAA